MNKSTKLFAITALALSIFLSTFTSQGQSTAPHNHANTFAIVVAVKPSKIPVGEPVKMILTVRNITQTPQTFPEEQIRVHGEAGEPAMTYMQRQRAGQLLPGEAQLGGGGAREVLQPGVSSSEQFNLLALYDLKKPGKYKVYVEIEDEGERQTTGKVIMVRSPLATFEITAPRR